MGETELSGSEDLVGEGVVERRVLWRLLWWKGGSCGSYWAKDAIGGCHHRDMCV